MRILHILLLALLCSACASPGKQLNRVSLGMNKGQVIDMMGEPESVKAKNGIEVLAYRPSSWSMESWDYRGEYWIVLEQGKVVQYGKAGDFDSFTAQKYDMTVHNQ